MTYVYERLGTNEIARALRQDTNAGWSYDGAFKLAEYLEQLAEDCGEPIELDIVALRCEFSEWKNINEFRENYSDEYATFDAISDVTTLIMIDDTAFITQDF